MTIDYDIRTRQDVQQVLLKMLAGPAENFNSKGNGLHLGYNTAHYEPVVAEMEGLLRALFGIAPLLAGGGSFPDITKWRKAIVHGTDPENDGFWGYAICGDQRIVEMTTLALAILLIPDQIWEPLDTKEKENLAAWLYTVNSDSTLKNNWAFFVIFVNEALRSVNCRYNEKMIEKMLSVITDCIMSNGWYSDGADKGKHCERRDYYIPFAMHFYGLIYAKLFQNQRPDLCNVFRQQARLFAPQFQKWFAADGAAVPFGRSLTYRMAQGAFWGALAFADEEALPWGIVKGLYMRHLRWWLQQPVFDKNGILSLGYAYPNLKMTEFYNSPGSPYWAFKIFLPLALPDNHPFWMANEESQMPEGGIFPQTEGHLLVCKDPVYDHTFFLTGGQYAAFNPTGMAAKYEKFAYSSVFGFSIPASEYGLRDGAFDSALALCEEEDNLFRVRRNCVDVQIQNNVLYSEWKPWRNVTVKTWLIPCLPWHIRIHQIDSQRDLTAAEGGFAIDIGDERPLNNTMSFTDEKKAVARNERGTSIILNLQGKRSPVNILPAPNTNVLYPRTRLPMLEGRIAAGHTQIACAVLGIPEYADMQGIEFPSIRYETTGIELCIGRKKQLIKLPDYTKERRIDNV